MRKLLIPSLIEVLKPTAASFLRLVKGFRIPFLCRVIPNQIMSPSLQPDLNVLNCRVQLTNQKKDDSAFDAFTVQICGSIHAPCRTTLKILITDVTDGSSRAKPVHSCIKQWQIQDSPLFCYNAELGRIPNADSTLSDWTDVARLHLDWLRFPHKGKRKLQFSTSILSRQSGEELACAVCTFTYDNATPGYNDLQENIQRTKTLTVALAFAVSASDNKLFN